MEQQQQVAAAEAKLQAAEEEAKQIRVLAKAKADEIRLINDAIAKNPAYIKLQSLEALKQISKDPAAKIYFMDSNSPQPLPLMHMGDSVTAR
jgi:regulator of protease activity HflC (stomatin/prohibitin superfamily)